MYSLGEIDVIVLIFGLANFARLERPCTVQLGQNPRKDTHTIADSHKHTRGDTASASRNKRKCNIDRSPLANTIRLCCAMQRYHWPRQRSTHPPTLNLF